MGRFLHHPAFRLLLAVAVVFNAITIGLQTDPTIQEANFTWFAVVDTIVLSFLLCEVLLNWYHGFGLYWKDGWNFFNFLIVLLLYMATYIQVLTNRTFVNMLRVMRLLQVCTLFSSLTRMIQVILQSIPDMATIMILLFSGMLIFSVFGVTLFGNMIPDHFGNLGTALYSLFICITQDGWLNIYEDFLDEELGLQIVGAIYFFIFITGAAFICANLLVAVVTTKLEQCLTEYNEKQLQLLSQDHSDKTYADIDDIQDDDAAMAQSPMHVREVMEATPMVHRQELLSLGNFGNLNSATLEDLCVVLEAIQENLKEYRAIRDELNQIVQEVRSIKFNREQEQEVVLRNIRASNLSDPLLGDVLTTLTSLEKANIIESDFQKGVMKTAALRARRQSLTMTGESSDEAYQESTVQAGPSGQLQKHRVSLDKQQTQGSQKREEASGSKSLVP
ncbi:cation channel sperm-associated protein 4 isoform X2 [Hemicordylus capensis]|nr:cation channel sperm-associated protein 4 isoform X2 [Hemicordylus capensis]